MGLLWKIGGIALACAAAFFLIRMYGGAQFNAGRLDERSQWEGKVADAADARLAGYEKGIARSQAAEVSYHETIRDRIVPVTKTIVERATQYAQTPDGASLCLPVERVQLLDSTRRALFHPAPTAAPGSGPAAVHTDAAGGEPRRLDVQSAGGAEPRAR